VIRDAADWETLLDAAELWVTTDGLVLERTTLTGITYSEWGTSGFTGFHQRASRVATHTYSGGNQLPPQCAAVISLLNKTEAAVSVKRRRGRIYLGQLPVSQVDGDGMLTSAAVSDIIGHFQNLSDAYRGVPAGSAGGTAMDGLCIVSEAEGVIMEADVGGVGFAVDTQRRRRRKRVEAIDYLDI